MYRENIGETVILEMLDEVLGRYTVERLPEERLGDFTIRAGIVHEVVGSDHGASDVERRGIAASAQRIDD